MIFNEKVERNKKLRLMVLDGSTFVEAAKTFGIKPNSVRVIFLRECRKLNAAKFDAGILKESSNNYITPPISYLRDNKHFFI